LAVFKVYDDILTYIKDFAILVKH